MVIERPVHGFNGWGREASRRPLSRGALLTIAGVAGLHLAGAAYLYFMHTAAAPVAVPQEGPVIVIDRVRRDPPKPQALPKTPPKTPPRAAPVHQPAQSTPTAVETLPTPAQTKPTAAVDDRPPMLTDTTGTLPPPMPTPPKVIRNPTWLARPSADQLTGFYPSGALDRGISGEAVLDCTVTATGQLIHCGVSGETPPREGFGAAALKASRIFRMSPRTEDGQPVEGGVVHIPMHFALQ